MTSSGNMTYELWMLLTRAVSGGEPRGAVDHAEPSHADGENAR